MRLKQWGVGMVCCAALLLTACRVVDLDENGKPIIPADPNARVSFENQTPQQIAQQTWNERVQTAAQSHALDASTLASQVKSLPPGKSESVFVRLSGKVERVEISSEREKKLVIRVNGAPLTVQTGPVIRGNAIRDAAGFKFEDFTNQVQFAQLSRAYNRDAAKHLPPVDESWTGKPVTLLAALTLKEGEMTDAAALDLKQEAQ
ncbi:MAG TPA: hypothetical protein DCY50_03425 [Franconibacter helveticus]|nr:hypothetical protein [Franconibacter helveticus]